MQTPLQKVWPTKLTKCSSDNWGQSDDRHTDQQFAIHIHTGGKNN